MKCIMLFFMAFFLLKSFTFQGLEVAREAEVAGEASGQVNQHLTYRNSKICDLKSILGLLPVSIIQRCLVDGNAKIFSDLPTCVHFAYHARNLRCKYAGVRNSHIMGF